MKINIFQSGEDNGAVVQVLQTISYGDEAVIEYSHNSGFELTTENMAQAAYLLISAIFLCIFLLSIYKIKRLRKKYPETKIEDVSFINTNEKGTPFSFFRFIFWNQAIDLHSRSGQQIFNHEIAHVKEKHSYDKIFMNIVLIFFWLNPFFWLMRKELYMIHEFIADKEALEDSDISSFAEMILQTVYPGQHFSSTNSFFYSPIKRRILMLTKNKNPKVNYISRLLVLPLAAIVFFAFALKVKNSSVTLYNGKAITVVIDAGHGGSDNGAVSANGLKEKDITLSIAKNIAAFNSNQHIKILLSRDNDETIPVNDRVAYAKNNKADLFISIHINSSADKQINGFSVLVDKQNTEQNLALGSSLINALKETYKTEDKIGVRKNGVFVLDKNICPAALIECGFLSNNADADFISNSANQEKIAKNVLDAINSYASSKENADGESSINISDTIPGSIRDSIPYAIFYKGKKLKYTDDVDNDKKVEATYSDGSKETITKEEALKRGFIPSPQQLPGLTLSNFKSNPLYIIDGKIYTNKQAKTIDPKNIESINVIKGEDAIKKYGDKGKKGVIEIATKKDEIFTATADTVYIGRDSSAKAFSGNKNFSGIEKFYGKAIYINSKFPEGTLILADGKEISQEEMKNISPNNIQSVNILKGETAIKKYGEKAKEGAVEITTKKAPGESIININGTNTANSPIIFLDGKEISNAELKNIPPNTIYSINVLKGKSAEEKYGAKGENGAVEITSKIDKAFAAVADTIYFRSDSSFKPISVKGKFKGDITFIKSKIPQSALIFADGKEISSNEMKNIPPDNIQSINVLKGESAIEKYGEKGKDGAIEITIKSKS